MIRSYKKESEKKVVLIYKLEEGVKWDDNKSHTGEFQKGNKKIDIYSWTLVKKEKNISWISSNSQIHYRQYK